MIEFATAHPGFAIFSLCFSLPTNIWIASQFYGNLGNFLEALRFFYQPFWLSAVRDEAQQDLNYSFTNMIFGVIAMLVFAAFLELVMKLYAL